MSRLLVVCLLLVMCGMAVDGSLRSLHSKLRQLCPYTVQLECPSVPPTGQALEQYIVDLKSNDCSCNKSYCPMEGSCCLDAIKTLPTAQQLRNIQQMTCEWPQLRPIEEGVQQAASPLRLIRRCPLTTSASINEMCTRPNTTGTILSLVPVTDIYTLLPYGNINCAECNGVPKTRIAYWEVKLECSLIDEDIPVNDLDTITQTVSQTDDCNLVYEPPSIPGVSRRTCRDVVSACNETGLWRKYDSTIDSACLAYSSVYTSKYRNVFCFICNTDMVSESEIMDVCLPGGEGFVEHPSFGALLRLPDINSQQSQVSTREVTVSKLYNPFTVSRSIRNSYYVTLNVFTYLTECVNAILGLSRSDYTLCTMIVLFLVYSGLTTHFVL